MTLHDVVLIVDDVPDNLAVLHDALDEAGYTVLVARSGEQALPRAVQAQPDIILLDALMPGMDGFEVARRLKADGQTAHIPVVFMTGLTETEHVVAALAAGGVDYVTKPIKPAEVLARMAVHLATARRARSQAQQALQARSALDAFGYASMTVRVADGRVLWQTPLARTLLQRYGGTALPVVPQPVREWMQRHQADVYASSTEPPRMALQQQTAVQGGKEAVEDHVQNDAADYGGEPSEAKGEERSTTAEVAAAADSRLLLHLHPPMEEGSEGELLVVMREASGTGAFHVLRDAFALTAKEAEVLYWVAQGKINRDIADIVGSSPATVKKHLERIHAKLGVETRTAAAAMALGRLRQAG